MPENQPKIDISSLRYAGSQLQRPECVLANEAGDLFTCDLRGVVAHSRSSGEAHVYGSSDSVRNGLKSNGIALLPDRSFLFANLGGRGGVWSLAPDGQIRPFLQEVDGEQIPSTNFVHRDDHGRIWVCVSTRHATSHHSEYCFSPTQDDGYIALVDEKGPRIVADGLVWTNECRVSPSGSHLYVNETMARRLTRYAIREDGSLSARETIAHFEDGTWPDGLAFDAEGGIWITSPISNRIIRVCPDGEQQLILEDCDHRHVEQTESAFLAGKLTREAIYNSPGNVLKHLSSLAFGGPDLRTVFLGSLGGTSIPYFRSQIAGHPMSHWKVRV
jgi:sugar lactone lactonase YvrE